MHGKFWNTTQSKEQKKEIERKTNWQADRLTWHIDMMCARYTLHHLSRLLLSRIGIAPSRMWLSRMLKRWRWSFKNINHKHVRKFMQHNILYYGQYLVNIRTIPMDRIKFIDEASFSSRGNCNQHNTTQHNTRQDNTAPHNMDKTRQDTARHHMTRHDMT